MGQAVGLELGLAVLGTGVGAGEGLLLGAGVGKIVGRGEGFDVGSEDGEGVGIGVGAYVGPKVTACTPLTPVMTARPSQAVFPRQPSRMMYVCIDVPMGTVYCTCAQTS